MKKLNLKKSSTKQSTAALNTLTKLGNALREGGTVTYYFVEDRIKFTKKHPDGIIYQNVSVQRMPLNRDIMLTPRGTARSLTEILQVLVDWKWDLKADYFIIA